MAIEFKKAHRSKAKLRLAIAGPSGAGKTYSALLIASGIVPLEKVAVIDTESGSADLYADLGGYSTVTINPPYSPQKYIEAIHAAEAAGFELIIIDSLSHAWSGEGGLLDQQGKAADSKYRGNSWAAWREITPLHNQLVETMLHTPLHVIVTMRSKTEYIQTDVNGRKQIQKVGMAPIQRDGIEYEFTTVFDLSQNHTATVSKDRTKLFDGQYFTPTADCGKALLQWLNAGAPITEPAPVIRQAATPAVNQMPVNSAAGKPQDKTHRQRLERIWAQIGWDKTQPLDTYMTARIQGQRGAAATVNDATDADWLAVDREITKYLIEQGQAKIAEPLTGEPLLNDTDVPF